MTKQDKKDLRKVLSNLLDQVMMAEWEVEKAIKNTPNVEDVRCAVYTLDNAEEAYYKMAAFLKRNKVRVK